MRLLKTSLLREFRTLKPHLHKYSRSYIFGFAFLILADAGQILIPRLIGQAVDHISDGTATRGIILHLMIQMVLLANLIALGRYGWRNFIIGSARHIEADIRDRIYGHFLILTNTFYINHKTGDLMARISNDLKSIRMSVGMGSVALIDGSFMTVVILGALFLSYGFLGLLIVIPLPLLTAMALILGRLLGPLFLKVQENFARISEHVQETLTGIRVIKSFVMEKRALTTFTRVNDNYARAHMNLVRFWGMMFPAMGFLAGLGVLLLLYFGGRAVIDSRVSPGDFIAMLSYLGMLVWPAMGAGWVISIMQRGAASMKRINEILNEIPDITDLPDAIETPPSGNLEFRSVSYQYNKKKVLLDVSCTVKKGTSLGILGRTGAGKTTLLKLLTRIIDPSEACIFIGDQDIRAFTRTALRRTLGVVSQDVFLFSETIRSNIVFARPEASDSEVANAVKAAGLESDLPFFPEGLETIVGEKGIILSGGQKQRIAIARAIITKPEILVLDDALSAVDVDTEERILDNLFAFREGGTTVLISHRVSALSRCDRCIVMEDGKVTAEGTHEELLKKNEFYREISDLQKLESDPGKSE